MSSQQVKIKWPFKKGEKARLIWIGDPFRNNNNKMMLHAYFRARGVTEKILMDWGTLPCLAIQHYYSDGVITKNVGTSMEVMNLQPHAVSYFLLKARMSFCQSLKC